MAKKKKEEVLKLTNSDNILLENNADMEKITNNLEKYVDERVNKVFVDEIRDVNRKLLREKSKKIFIKNIVIIILLLIIGFLVYLLYTNNYFDRFFSNNASAIQSSDKKDSEDVKEEVKEEIKEEIKEEKKEPTLEELKKEYAGYLDKYVLSDTSSYVKDFYNGELTDNLKYYFTLNSMDFDSLTKEDDYHIILGDTFKEAYNKLFDGDCSFNSFDYNGNNIRYVSIMKSYITTKLLTKSDSLIKREITNIKVDGEKILITTIEGVVKDNKLYNSLNELIDENDVILSKHSDDLNKMVYTFKNSKLISLSK